jgi:hypothetical protein
MSETTLQEMVQALPKELQEEVHDFISFLLEKKAKKTRGKPRFDWAGALNDMKIRYTSVELQHKISEWRAGEK